MTLMEPDIGATTLPEALALWARTKPRETAVVIYGDGENEGERITFAALHDAGRLLAHGLAESGAARRPVLLPAEPTIEFVVGLCGCLLSGAVAVPVPVQVRNRGFDRLKGIVGDCGVADALHTGPASTALREACPELNWIDVGNRVAPGGGFAGPAPDSLALLQYTSGSTHAPKGVMVTHANLTANLKTLKAAFGVGSESRILTWLPLFHDMGLIGQLMLALYSGVPCALMRPLAFLKRPQSWLRAIAGFGATISGAPNFGYELCVKRQARPGPGSRDLSCWKVAFCGSEPVRFETMRRFAEAFAPCGFAPEALYPCYGLAEATLFVSGGRVGDGVRAIGSGAPAPLPPELVSCGRPMPEGSVVIVDADTLQTVEEGAEGEIWVAGDHVTAGYWNGAGNEAFGNAPAGATAGEYLRTGDIGTILKGELFITGRRKNLIIHRGMNVHLEDIEATVGASHAAFGEFGAAFSVGVRDGEELVVVAHEVGREYRNGAAGTGILDSAIKAVAEAHGIRLFDLVLLRPGGTPRTTSGKIQRNVCREMYLAKALDVAADAFASKSLGRHRQPHSRAPEGA